jgi:hypothetical protein
MFGSVLGSAAIFAWYEPNQDVPAASVSQPVASVTQPESEPILSHVGINTPQDYVSALNSALTINERARRQSAVAAALSEWAWADPEAVFAWLEAADPSLLSYASDALEVLTLSDPARVARLSRLLNRRYQYSVVLAQAAAELTERDRNAAISRLDALPAGQEYRAWRQGIADGFVARDPIAALSWAQSLDPASPETIDDVMAAVRSQDLELAFELAVASIAGGNTTGMDSMSWMTRNDAVDSATMARIGERIATLPREQATLLIQRFGEAWSVSAPQDALDWALEHWSVGQMMIPNIAINMRGSAAQSADIAARLPTGNREQWLRTNVSVSALNMLGSDPASLPEYLAQFEHEPFYDGLIDSLAFNVTSSPIWLSDPAAIETALESMPEGELRRALQEAVEASQQ